MNKTWLLCCVILVLFLVLDAGSDVAFAQNNVTFRVNMSIKMRETTFLPGSGDIVRVAGSFNDWGNSVDTLRDIGTIDSIYEKTISLATGGIFYKFLKTLRGGLDWESGDNRALTVVAGNQTLPVVWFDYDSVYTPPAPANITFRVNMRVKILETTFQPGSGDIVRVAGSFNDWGNSVDTLRDIAPIDSIYEKTISLLENAALQYKFLKTPRGGVDWEDGDNRTFTVPPGGAVLPAVYFNYDSVVNVPINANILWRVDMQAMQEIGWFNPGLNDSMQVRGGFEGWSGKRMSFNTFTIATYQTTLPYSGTSFDQLPHKYFMKLDSVSATTRFPGFATDLDGVQYDHPYERGDGNRLLDVGNGGNVSALSFYFGSIHRFGTMKLTTDTCRVTIRVNMGPATRYVDPFNPANDTVKMVWQDKTWRFSQVANQGSFPATVNMTRQGPTDSVWTATVTVKGKTHYGLMYTYRYVHPGGTSVDEGGGLGAQNPYRARFIIPTSPNVFPPTQTAALDSWQKNAPMPAQTPPYGLTGVIDEGETGQPVAYKLGQNYPNPFNPSTQIRYTVPENARVTLKVFNMLGQHVATLVDEQEVPGNYISLFEANALATGVYFYRLEAGKFSETKKMLLLK